MFIALFKRNLVYLLRNPRTQQAAVFNAVFLSLCHSAIFWMVCDASKAPSNQIAYANWIGVATILQNNLYFYGATTCIIQMPLWVPILKRELMNRMYTPSAYYLARVTSGIMF